MSRSEPLVILYADDEQDDIFLFEHAMRHARPNTIVRSVSDGEAAIQYLQGEGDYGDRAVNPFPDLVFVDWRMPKINGAEFLEWCRKSPLFGSLIVVVITGSSSPHDAKMAKLLGASGVMFKPASSEELADRVSEICDVEMMKV